jgi:hypothetical protein
VTTLLYQFHLGGLLDFLVDDNPVRHNLFSPGHHIPVLPSEALNERRPDCVVILAWNMPVKWPASAPLMESAQKQIDFL